MLIYKQNEINEINEALNKGAIIAVPTETVFGLAVKLNNKEAIENLNKLKERESKPLSMMIYNKKDINKYCVVSDLSKKIINNFFPGKLTLVLSKNKDFKNTIFDTYNTIGIRIPNHKFMLDLLKVTGPLIVTSANNKGENPCLDSKEVINKLKIDGVVEGESGKDKPSTVILIEDDNIELLREGSISLEDINDFLK